MRELPKLPNITAPIFLITDHTTGQPLLSKRSNKRCEIASLTKIMTALTAISIIEKYDISWDTDVFVPEQAMVVGTTAKLEPLSFIKLSDLFYGLMLPSGNDAAQTLAYFLGGFVKKKSSPVQKKLELSKTSSRDLYKKQDFKENKKNFIKLMNVLSKTWGMKDSQWENVHGLGGGKKINQSTAEDCSIMSSLYLEHDWLKEVASTKSFTCQGHRMGFKITYNWKNTNKLLGIKEVFGLKTGITPSAGPCLATSFYIKHRILICIVVNCKSNQHRFLDTERLIDFCKDILEN